MLTFSYTAKEISTGKVIKAHVKAESEREAANLLIDRELVPLSISLKGDSEDVFGGIRNRVGTKDKVLFTRQLATLINAGLPLTQSLRTVAEQTESKALRQIIDQVTADVEGGTSLSSAFSQHPKVFNLVYVSLVAAGESSGTLDKTLERLATQQ